MPNVLTELVELLGLERIEKNLFRGQSQDLGWGRIYGGQVLGQALSAATQTVDESRTVHSFHSYFLRPGMADRPVVYDVDRIRDGKSFTTRRVVAIQEGRPIFNLAASFQVAEEGFEHQAVMPEAKGPEGLASDLELAHEVADLIPEKLRPRALSKRPIEIRQVEPYSVLQPVAREPARKMWIKTAGTLGDAATLHQYLLAYASDFNFLITSMHPHGVSWLSPDMQVASLDHAMWFHRPFRFDDWLLYVIDSPSASGARGLVRGELFTRDGQLVASAVQEGLIRKWDEPKASS